MKCNYKSKLDLIKKENEATSAWEIIKKYSFLFSGDLIFYQEKVEKSYRPLTTFYLDLICAEKSEIIGINVRGKNNLEMIKDVYDSYMSNYKDDYKVLSELIMAMSLRCLYAEIITDNEKTRETYLKLIYEADEYAFNNVLNDNEKLQYYMEITQ